MRPKLFVTFLIRYFYVNSILNVHTRVNEGGSYSPHSYISTINYLLVGKSTLFFASVFFYSSIPWNEEYKEWGQSRWLAVTGSDRPPRGVTVNHGKITCIHCLRMISINSEQPVRHGRCFPRRAVNFPPPSRRRFQRESRERSIDSSRFPLSPARCITKRCRYFSMGWMHSSRL